MLNHHSLAKLIQIPLKMDLRSTKVILRSLFCPNWSINQSIFGFLIWNSRISGVGGDWAKMVLYQKWTFWPNWMKFWGQMRSFGSVNFIKWSNVTQWNCQFRKDFTKIGQLLTIFKKRDDSIAHFDIDIRLTSKSNLFQKVILDSFGKHLALI